MKRHVAVYQVWMVLVSLTAQSSSATSNPDRATLPDAEGIDLKQAITKADRPRPMEKEIAPALTFAEAFRDPNILIGVFTWSLAPDPVGLSSGQILETQPGFLEASSQFSLTVLHLEKPLKGKFVEPIIIISTLLPPIFEGQPRTPYFVPPPGSKWVLALERTTPNVRVARFGKDIEQYKFLTNNTMFKVLWHGYGALCLRWPEDDKRFQQPSYLAKVPEAIVSDLDAIARVMPAVTKSRTDPNEAAAVANARKTLQTDLAKAILARIQTDQASQRQDPNGASR